MAKHKLKYQYDRGTWLKPKQNKTKHKKDTNKKVRLLIAFIKNFCKKFIVIYHVICSVPKFLKNYHRRIWSVVANPYV